MTDWRKDVETVREYIAHNATSKETPRAEALAALASLQAAYEALERERDEGFALNDSLKERVGEYLARAAAAERERDDERTGRHMAEDERGRLQHVIDCANTPLMRDVLRERDELREALRGIQGWIESEFREGDKEFQVALACRAALASGKDKP